MLISSASFAALAGAVTGLLVVWSNPHRLINRYFLGFSLHMMMWLLCVHFGVAAGEDPFWVRLASAVGAFGPLDMWLVKEACVGRGIGNARRQIWFWVLGGLLLAAIAYSPQYVQRNPLGGSKFGPAYAVYMIVFGGLYGFLLRQTIRDARAQTGIARLELQVLLVGGCSMCFAIVILMAVRGLVGGLWPIHMQPIVVLIFYAATVVAITTHRVFDARQIVLVGLKQCILVVGAAGIAYIVEQPLEWASIPKPVAWLFTAGIVLWCASLLRKWLEEVFRFYPEGIAARQAAFDAAREVRAESLESGFAAVLKGWGQADNAIILSGGRGVVAGGGIEIAADGRLVSSLRKMKWATPERLGRERPTPERAEVMEFLLMHRLGAVAVCEGPALTVVVGVGLNAARRPFTYPQVAQLLELASIFESALERAHFSVKAQHAEQLATVGLLGASLAHEIRNPLVSIKTFVQLLPTHHHDPRFREKFFKLIGDEVTRIDQLTEQLLDLASPRTYEAKLIELHPLLRSSLDLVAAKASHRNVRFLTEFAASPDAAFTDASAAKQVMLNLCFNAIQAVEAHAGEERWVKIATRNTPAGIEMAVADSGPGIAPEMRPKLFQPFQTTKSSGFGLGLAICSDILSNLHASISVDPPSPGQGATFRVTFPCQPLSS